jgi:lysophospholipase L1-like esterase
VQAIVDLIKAHVNADGSVPRVVVSAFIPNLLLEEWGSGAIAQYNASLVARLTGIDLWTTDSWDDLYDPQTGKARVPLMSDPIHPNREGYRLIAENCFAAIETLPTSWTALPDRETTLSRDAGTVDEWSL